MKKRLLSLICAFVLILGIAGCGSSGPATGGEGAELVETDGTPGGETIPAESSGIVIGLVQIDLEHPFHLGEVEGAQEAARRYGAELKVVSGDGDVNKQIQAFENLVSQQVDAISVNCIDVNAFGPAFHKAADAGIPVVILHSRSDMAQAYVGFDEGLTGKACAEYSVQLLTEKNGEPRGEVAVLMGMLGQSGIAPRSDDFIAHMEQYPDITVVASEPTDWDPVKAVQLTENWLTAYPNLDLVYGCSDGVTVPAAEAIENAGKRDQILVTSVDGSDFALEAIREGKMESTFMYAAQYAGYMKALVPIQIATGAQYSEEVLMSGILINAGNVEAIERMVRDMDEGITEFDFEVPLDEIVAGYVG